MSTASLPSYVPPSVSRTPSYTAEPQAYEQRLALNQLRPRPSGEFSKQSKSGGLNLRLLAQEDNVELPVYGTGGTIEGIVEIAKTEGVHSVDVKIKGSLKLKEIAEGGTTTHELCLSRLSLWNKDRDEGPCPPSLKFNLTLPTTFYDGKDDCPLPPTYEVHLSGLPGFRATVEYSVTANVDRGLVKKAAASLLLPLAPKQNNNSISTPFVYYPRSRPATPLPPAMTHIDRAPGIAQSLQWRCTESVVQSRSKAVGDIKAQFYIPASRVFSLTEPIPFHLSFISSAHSLSAFLPYGPTASLLSPNKQYTKVQLLRQSIVDVRNTVVFGTKTDIWRVRNIGNGAFRRAVDGPDFISYVGEINIASGVDTPSFRAGGLFIKDFISLTMIPPVANKSPFDELRVVFPVRLTTDAWTNDGSGQGQYEFNVPSSPDDSPEGSLSDYHGDTA